MFKFEVELLVLTSLLPTFKEIQELNIKKIFVVTGYNSEKIKEKLKDSVNYIHNDEFATTNNIPSYISVIERLDRGNSKYKVNTKTR